MWHLNPHELLKVYKKLFDDAIKAQEDEKRFKAQAYAYVAKVIPIAEGKASRIQQEAEAYSKQVVFECPRRGF
ncbi:protease subunit HflK [Legionella sainthelensi]|nr:protease subunit HflK [Legionella sainthelensi]